MARWVISPIIGDGTSDIVVGSEATTGPYRLKASDYGAHAAIIPGNNDGTPMFNWGICHFDGDVTAAETDSDLTVLPELSMDHEITLTQRNWLRSRLQNHGLPYLWVNTGDTVREILRTIGRYLDDKFDVDWLLVSGWEVA
jgi:hypothetical protein